MRKHLQNIDLALILLAAAWVLWGCSVDYQRRPITHVRLPAPSSTHSLRLIYYVATTGSDTNPGTEAQPFLTVSRGVSVLTPGDTLYILGGTYAESLLDNIPAGISWNAPVTIAAAPGHTVILKPNSVAGWVLHFQGPQQYIIIDGLVLDATNVVYDAVKITEGGGAGSAHHIRLIRCEVKNAPGQGILVTQFADLNEFIDLNVYDNGSSRYDHGFYISTSNNLVEGSTIHHNTGYGVHVYNSNEGRANHNTVRNNKIFDNGYVGGDSAGIILGSGDSNSAYNNLVWHNRAGIQIAYSNPSNTTVYNNTVYANFTYGIYIHGDSSGTIIRNNLLNANGHPEIQNNGVGSVLDHNLAGTDPKFVNAATGDFHLQPGSPAIDGGIMLDTVTTDIEGTLRPQGGGHDLGAYEMVQ